MSSSPTDRTRLTHFAAHRCEACASWPATVDPACLRGLLDQLAPEARAHLVLRVATWYAALLQGRARPAPRSHACPRCARPELARRPLFGPCLATFIARLPAETRDAFLIEEILRPLAITPAAAADLPDADDAPTPDLASAVPRLPSVPELERRLGQSVVGQARAVRQVALAAARHYEECLVQARGQIEQVGKHHVLLLGPTGSGKTELAQALARALDVPFARLDGASLTAPGYIGGNVEEAWVQLLNQARGDLRRARYGVVFIDEIDKKRQRETFYRDVYGEDVQAALLAVLEGAMVPVRYLPELAATRDAGADPRGAVVWFDTSRLFFLCAGAFSGLAALVEQRLQQARGGGIGFATAAGAPRLSEGALLAQARPADLEAYGLKPELIGRLANVAVIEPLAEETLARILRRERDSLVARATARLRLARVELVLEEGAYLELARQALASGLGARALQVALDRALDAIDAGKARPEKGAGRWRRATVTAASVRGEEAPRLTYLPDPPPGSPA